LARQMILTEHEVNWQSGGIFPVRLISVSRHRSKHWTKMAESKSLPKFYLVIWFTLSLTGLTRQKSEKGKSRGQFMVYNSGDTRFKFRPQDSYRNAPSFPQSL